MESSGSALTKRSRRRKVSNETMPPSPRHNYKTRRNRMVGDYLGPFSQQLDRRDSETSSECSSVHNDFSQSQSQHKDSSSESESERRYSKRKRTKKVKNTNGSGLDPLPFSLLQLARTENDGTPPSKKSRAIINAETSTSVTPGGSANKASQTDKRRFSVGPGGPKDIIGAEITLQEHQEMRKKIIAKKSGTPETEINSSAGEDETPKAGTSKSMTRLDEIPCTSITEEGGVYILVGPLRTVESTTSKAPKKLLALMDCKNQVNQLVQTENSLDLNDRENPVVGGSNSGDIVPLNNPVEDEVDNPIDQNVEILVADNHDAADVEVPEDIADEDEDNSLDSNPNYWCNIV